MKLSFINGILNYPVRAEMFEGRRHVVMPVVALVEGVHSGSGGPLFYPWNEISKYPAAWNGRPVTVSHPRDEGGDPISANSPQIIGESSIGRVFNMTAADGRLSGELWLDEEKTRRISSQILSMVWANEPIEESAGLFSDLGGGPGSWNGEDYEATVINIRPDHIALLPGEVGACSIEDGCGVRANVRGTARTPSFEGTESTSWASVTKTFGAYRDGYYASHGGAPDDPVSRVQDAPTAMRNWIASKTLLGEGSADNERDLMMFPVVNPKSNKLNEGALRAVLGGRASMANIPDSAKTSAQNKARALLNRYFEADLEVSQEESFMKKALKKVAATINAFLGNQTSHEDIGAQLREWADKQDTVERINWVRDVYDNWFVHEVSIRNPATGARVANKMYRRSYTVDDNGQVSITDDAVEVIEKKEYVPAENPPAANKDVNNQISTKEKTEMKKKEELIKALIACPDNALEESDQEWLNGLTEEQLDRLRVSEAPEKEKTDKEPTDNKQDPPEAPESPPGKPEPDKQVTLEEYVKAAPPEIGQILSEAVEERKAFKAKLIEGIFANETCTFKKEELEAMDVRALKNIAGLAKVELPEHDYTGQAGGAGDDGDEDAVPPMPLVFEPAKKE